MHAHISVQRIGCTCSVLLFTIAISIETDMSDEEQQEQQQQQHQQDPSPFRDWYPRDILRRTNWLYRIDALRPHDRREMQVLWDLTWLFQEYATQFLLKWNAS